MTELCPKCGRRFGLTQIEIAQVGNLLQCNPKRMGCGVVLMVTKAGPSPCEFELRLATEDEKNAAIHAQSPP